MLSQVGGNPPSDDFVAVSPEGMIKHFKGGNVIEERSLMAPDAKYLNSETLARNMLMSSIHRKRKKAKAKVKRCKCK